MRYASVCSGVEAASLAWIPLGWEAVWFSEIEPFPCAVLKERFPDVPNLGDMTKIEGEKYRGAVDLLVGGTPCFVAGTMVLTPCGYKPIESLKVGDSVVTHTGDVRNITAIGSKEAQTGEVKILGRPPIRCTGNHPFYSIEVKRDNSRKSPTCGQKTAYGEYEFKAVEDSVGRYAGRVVAKRVDGHIPTIYNATPAEIMELAGWYLGDGYIRYWAGKNKKAVIIAAVCKRKIDQFSETFNGAIQYSIAKDGKITITNTVLANWLIANFGEKSHSKKLPYWIYTSELRDRLIAGYEKTDGSRRSNGNIRITTTSATLAYGMADLYGNASVDFRKRETTHVIMGRKVSQRDTYTIYKAKGKTARTKMLCGRYASIIRGWNNDGAIRTVYNITVDGEHSYIVNGIAVHNCQGFSVAGKQGGLNDLRSALCLSYCRLLETMRPRWFVWENVPGVFSTNGGEDFRAFLRKIDEIGYSCAWRVLDAQYVRVDGFPRAVPQRRRRVFVVGHLGGDWRYPASVLFEPGCLPGDTPPRRIKGKGFAAGFAGGPETASGIDGYNGTVTGNISTTVDGHCKLPNGSNLVGRLWNASGVNPTLNQCNAGSGIIGASNQELFSQNANGLVMDAKFWNGKDVSTTLTEAFADDRMPDKGKLPCVITESGNGFYSESAVGQTLEAHEDQHRRNIICAGFCQGASPAAGSIGYHEQVSPTIKAGESGTAQIPALICFHGSQDTISNPDHANAIGRNQGAENCVCIQQNQLGEVRIGNICGTLNTNSNASGRNTPICFDSGGFGQKVESDVASTLSTNHDDRVIGNNAALVQECYPNAAAIAENIIGRKENNGGNGRPLNVIEVMATGQANAETATDHCVNLTCNHEAPIICARFSGGQGKKDGEKGENQNADAEKARAVKILRLLRDEIGEKAFCEWTLGRLGSFQAEKVLQPNLHGESVRREADNNNGKVNMSISCTEDCPIYDMRDVWCGKCNGCSPQGQGFYEQCSGELNASMSQMSQSDSCKKEDVCNMRNTAKGTWLLRKALGKIQEIRQPASVQTQSVRHDTRATVRRLLVVEAERLMGFPDNHTRIPWRGKPAEDCPDSPRYKACGNSMCVNVMRWIGMRIENVERRMKGIDNEYRP